ncbi:MAG TPA: alkaline phosphatase family protein [Terriglobales bacterium]|nr:alkaline phosphatase family protein [Terriglobales bacterium]
MPSRKRPFVFLITLLLALSLVAVASDDDDAQPTKRVLLISIDGMHAVDFENCASNNTCPNLAALAASGVTYTRASASKPSDSFPGLMNIVTGGTPKTHGAFYDLAFDRSLAPPAANTGNGLLKGSCTPGVFPGTTTEYEEGTEFNQTQLNGGAPGASLTDGSWHAIDPAKLPRDPANGCAPVYPWNFIRTNTIFGVIHAAGGRTAWSDKHGTYASVSGPTGTAIPSNLDDYYSPEINSNVVNLPGVKTPAGFDCSAIMDPANPDFQYVDTFKAVQCYDTLKVQAVLNWIKGFTHLGTSKAPVPNLFGMNFQAVSVGQKLIRNGVKGGYVDNAATPTAPMLDEIQFVDASIGQMVNELTNQRLLDSTLIVITAKHGQSPIDTHQVKKFKSTSPAHLLHAFLRPSTDPTGSNIGPTEDDVSLLWLADSSGTQDAVNILETNAPADGVGEIFYGPSLTTMSNSPLNDSRTPDIIVQPNVGVIYSTSGKKQAEHGGFAHDDTNVMLLVSKPGLHAKTVTAVVETTQVAPTILQALGLDANSLKAVKAEGTQVLPALFTAEGHQNDEQ